jgi:hypothetical protein
MYSDDINPFSTLKRDDNIHASSTPIISIPICHSGERNNTHSYVLNNINPSSILGRDRQYLCCIHFDYINLSATLGRERKLADMYSNNIDPPSSLGKDSHYSCFVHSDNINSSATLGRESKLIMYSDNINPSSTLGRQTVPFLHPLR